MDYRNRINAGGKQGNSWYAQNKWTNRVRREAALQWREYQATCREIGVKKVSKVVELVETELSKPVFLTTICHCTSCVAIRLDL